MLHLSEFVWTQRSSVLVVFNNFLLIDATAIEVRLVVIKSAFIALSLYPHSFFANTPPLKITEVLLISQYCDIVQTTNIREHVFFSF